MQIYVLVHVRISGGIGQGHLQMCRQVGRTLLHMHIGFSHLNEEAGDCDIIIMMSLSYCLCK